MTFPNDRPDASPFPHDRPRPSLDSLVTTTRVAIDPRNCEAHSTTKHGPCLTLTANGLGLPSMVFLSFEDDASALWFAAKVDRLREEILEKRARLTDGDEEEVSR